MFPVTRRKRLHIETIDKPQTKHPLACITSNRTGRVFRSGTYEGRPSIRRRHSAALFFA